MYRILLLNVQPIFHYSMNTQCFDHTITLFGIRKHTVCWSLLFFHTHMYMWNTWMFVSKSHIWIHTKRVHTHKHQNIFPFIEQIKWSDVDHSLFSYGRSETKEWRRAKRITHHKNGHGHKSTVKHSGGIDNEGAKKAFPSFQFFSESLL